MSRIMIVDDDDYIRELVGTLLTNEGFSVCEAADGRSALQQIGDCAPDLCIVDVMMPGMDGFELCRYIRLYYENIPVLMLTAKAEISQKIKGFEQGTDDYLTKPFEPRELILRVKALLRRYNVAVSQCLQVGSLVMDREAYSITAEGERMDIPMKEFDLLYQLASAAGRTSTRDRLIEEVWGYDFEGNERTLDVHINRLRERFPAEKYGFKITTIRGLGYRLEASS